MTTKEMVEIMLAYDRGEQIEWKNKGSHDWNSYNSTSMPPVWNWGSTDYRIKPQPTCRPYKNAAEFLAAQKEHGMWLREKVSQGVVMPLGVNDYRVLLPDYSQQHLTAKDFIYENLLTNFVWQDGTPCGVEE